IRQYGCKLIRHFSLRLQHIVSQQLVAGDQHPPSTPSQIT
ncbi:25163_t:CDS:1, partial [Gigaspora rosea]